MDEQSIFAAALDLEPSDERAAFLAEVCAGDSALRARVERLLQLHEDGGNFLKLPPAVAITADDPELPEAPGTVIGPYKLREKIGEGGFGVVYVAEQTEPVRRKVALKIIKPGMDTREIIARFEAERQALAMMEHPNIARVLDAGTTGEPSRGPSRSASDGVAGVERSEPPDGHAVGSLRSTTATHSGRPYFVMELVKGIPITEFCDAQKLSTRERLELFVQVCRAVQHAHTKGIIHRDIKPSNVMVTLHDATPVPKVIDFGVAKALSSKLTEKTVYTAYGQMIGTPLYMSPEQAQLNEHDVDTRSDIYSLGVLLYELLTGTTPFDKETLQKSGFDEMRRIIREVEPPRPSARISTLKNEALSTLPSPLSERRGSSPPSEAGGKASTRRRIDAKKLSHSLRGELDWIVMKALEKDRNRRYETAAGLARDIERYLNDEPVHARPPSTAYRLRKFARRNSAALVTVGLVVISLLAGTGGSIWQAVRATNAEQLAQRRLEDVGKQQQRAEANLQLALETLEQIYLPLAQDELAEVTELSERDRQFLQKALPFYEQLAAQKADDPNMRYVKARAYLRVGDIYRNLHTHAGEKNEPAEAALRQAIALFEQLTAEFPGNLQYQRKHAQSYRSLGALLYPRRRPEAFEAFRTAIALYEPVVSEAGTAWDYVSRALCYRQINRYDEALADYRKAVELEPNNAGFHNNLLWLYGEWPDVRLRDWGLAVEHGQKAVELEPNNPDYQANLAYAYRWQGNLPAAREACAKALGLDANHAGANREMAVILLREGEDLHQALACAHKAVQRGYQPIYNAYMTRGDVYAKLGRYQEALADYDKALELEPGLAYLHRGRGKVYAKLGRYQEALADYTKAIELDPENLVELNDTAWAIVRDPGWEAQTVAQALTWVERAVKLAPENATVWNTLGVAHYRATHWKEAIAALEKCEELEPDKSTAFNAFFLAMSHWQLGRQDESRQWYDKAVVWMEKNRPDDEELLRFRAEAEELMGTPSQRSAEENRNSEIGNQRSENARPPTPVAAPKPNHD